MSVSTVEVSVRGVRSPVLTAGPRDGAEAVVFVHGNPGPADDWRDLLTRAGELGRAIAPDMPGYGGADKRPPRHASLAVVLVVARNQKLVSFRTPGCPRPVETKGSS